MQKRNSSYSADDTIAAVSTPVGEGGIGIVRLSGKKALSVADKIFISKDKVKPSRFKTYTVHYGHIIRDSSPVTRDSKGCIKKKNYQLQNTSHESRVTSHEVIDEVLLTVMRKPKSYTKEDIVEINCHGGVVCLRRILDLALSLGARLAEPGEFTKRAFINGRIDLAQAEAVLDIIKSKTESAVKSALGQLEGGLSDAINRAKEALLGVLSELEARIDFSEEDIEFTPREKIVKNLKSAYSEIKKLVDNAWKGMILKEGIMCVICGKPNVGKSSLMNAFLKRNRVIVTPVPGTTRDAIEEEVSLKGVPVRVVDTAGISRARNIAEERGIEKSKSYIKTADIILFMLDLGRKWSEADSEILNAIKEKNVITIANKSDLKRKLDLGKVKGMGGTKEIIEISLLKKRNLDKVEEAITRKVWRGEIPYPEGAFVTNLRHKNELRRAGKSLNKVIKALREKKGFSPEIASSDLKDAVYCLGSVLGDTIEADILDRIFSKFCVGK